jgi:flagellar protein FliS
MANPTNNAYLRNAVMTATPEQLQLMLYDGAIRFVMQGRDAIEQKDFEKIYNSLSRAQAIVLEMQRGLRREVNPELCDRMSAIYSFLYRKLVDASVNRSLPDVDDVLRILRYQRETWVMLIKKVAETRAESAGTPGQPTSPDSAMGQTDAATPPTLSVEG